MNLTDLKQGYAESSTDPSSGQEEVPSWLDKEKFKRGQQFFLRHMVMATFAMHCSLVVGFSLINLLEALVFTQQSDTPGKAIKRYLDTFLHIYRWHLGDVWGNPDDPAYKSLRLVRKMHVKVAEDMTKQDQKRKVLRDGDKSVLYLSQYDMGLVQVGFMGAITMYPAGFGLTVKKEELEDYIHFWRGIGHILGIKDNYNICSGNYQETFDLCKEIEEKILLAGLKNPAPNFHPMADAYCDGVNGMIKMPFYTKEALIAFTMDGMGRDFKLGPLSWADWVRFYCYKLFVAMIRWVPGFEHFLNKRAIRNFNVLLNMGAQERSKVFRLLADSIDGQTANRHAKSE